MKETEFFLMHPFLFYFNLTFSVFSHISKIKYLTLKKIFNEKKTTDFQESASVVISDFLFPQPSPS